VPLTPRERALALICYIFLCFAWGSTYIGISIVVKSMSPFWFAGSRWFLSGLLILALCPIVGARLPRTWAEWRPLAVMAFLYLILGNGSLCWAQMRVKGGVASILAAISPLLVALIMSVLPRGERLSPLGWAALVLGLGGVCLLFWDQIAAGIGWGEPVLLLACVSWSAATVFGRFYSPRYHPFAMTSIELLLGGAGLLAIGLAWEGPFHAQATLRTWVAYGYMVLVGGCLGFLAFTYLLQKIPAVKAATFGYVNPVVGMGLGAWIEGERYSASEIVGSAIVLAAVLIVHVSRRSSD
jgi:drug/metabolite transporter (DMT)-like permease